MRGSPEVGPYRVATLLQAADFDARFGAGETTIVNNALGGTKIFDLMAGTNGLPAWPGSRYAQIAVRRHRARCHGARHRGASSNPEGMTKCN